MKTFTRILSFTLTLLLAAIPVCADLKPNVIVIFTDDHGYADLSCQGIFDDVKTPHMDSLATGGVRMTEGYSTAPQCGPSRVGLISGGYQNKIGYEDNGSFADKEVLKRFLTMETLPKRLKKAGYATGMAGKSHLGTDESDGLAQLGFDKAFHKKNGGAGHWNMDLNGKDIEPQPQKGGYHLDMVSSFACAFIERYRNQPFFFYAAYRAPHTPLDAPPEYLKRFPDVKPESRRQALAMLSAVDDGVGRIMETLRRNKLEENTLIFVIGDNGAPLKKRLPGSMEKTPSWDGSLNDPLNGEKGTLIDGGIRTPFVVYWKGTIPGGQVYQHPVISLDVAATANALAGNESDPSLDGVNLLPYLTGEKKDAPHEALFWRWNGQTAVRAGNWKYIRGGDREYLFDMQNDISESKNLLSTNPEIARNLHAQLQGWSETLLPPGIPSSMPKAGESYFDWYLDGKRRGPSQAETEESKKKRAATTAKLFDRCDANKDGVVTFEEYSATRPGDRIGKIRQAFKKLVPEGHRVWKKSDL
ncbi:sulfatase [Haloferula chungangensis]|uniref:Sulfatase n=1 Tax=Haloferula chungangensis TaxID=1048331 RepID=A0ABW2L3K8_9BACT